MPEELTVVDADQETAWGAIGTEFPLWQAKEAMSQIEKRITAQTTTLGVYETRATTLLGWLSAEIIATATAAISSLLKAPSPVMDTGTTLILAASVLIPAMTSAFCLAKVFSSKDWSLGGVDIRWLMDADHADPSELEVLQEFAKKGLAGVSANHSILLSAYKWLTLGWKIFLVVPVSALIVSLFVALVK
ncbi:hypothetical protein AA0472_1490 [Acetobacter estunensis NRIC 0472]|uniref:Uncharacterized protein n=1 Tax=Acetobacter estunensis TaxID=104097 RepID=A0A967EH21_9PROT|nr:hypothetical protein [Acetobacter estunensis]NHO53077.1 hypothetical protein [Acetobacter estunensis]GBQ24643.1 hypothetical protein AA0472_1490 [Acetobacter estunensis NRIC 0472]